jgi:hypothetical protein
MPQARQAGIAGNPSKSSFLHARRPLQLGKNEPANAHHLVTRIGKANFFFAPLRLRAFALKSFRPLHG